MEDKDIIEKLKAAALAAGDQGYAPYSNFNVVASIRTSDDNYYGGANVENASMTLTVHAENAAIMAALRDGARQKIGQEFITHVFVICPDADRVAPCGLCRQSLREFALPGLLWIGENPETGAQMSASLEELLPFSFGPENL